MQIAATRYHGSVHLREGDLLPAAARCPWCDASQRERLLRLQSDPDVWLMRCSQCKAASADRMPTAACLDAYYAHYYDAAQGAHVTVADPEAAAAHIARCLALEGQRSVLRVLDFGGGDGALGLGVARRLRAAGAADEASVDVVDLAAAGLACSETGLVVRGHAALDGLAEATQFDVILASAVLEHLPAPRPILAALCARLAPGGRLYARTPWMAPLMQLGAPLGLRIDFTYPGHVHDLGGDFWAQADRLPGLAPGLRVARSACSFVETGLRQAPLRTLAAHVLKLPSRVLGARWPYVGGWEAVLARD